MVDASGHSMHKPLEVSNKKLVPSLDDQLDNVHNTCIGSHDQLSRIPYMVKHSREKTFVDFVVFKPSTNVFPSFLHYLPELIYERLKSMKVFQ